MELLGAAASLITLIALAKEITSRGRILAKRYRGYSKAIFAVRDRTIQLEVRLGLLSHAQKAISENNILPAKEEKKLLDTLSDTQVTFESIRDFLAQYAEEGGARVRFRWARKDEAEVEKWVNKLVEHDQGLSCVLNLLQVHLSVHGLKVTEASDSKLSVVIKNQEKAEHVERLAITRKMRQQKNKAGSGSGSDDGMLCGLVCRLPTDMPYLAFLRNYGVQFSFSVIIKSITSRNAIPETAKILEACKLGDALGVKQILDSGQASPHDITPLKSTPLRFAIESGSISLVQLLLDYGADPDTPFGQLRTSPVAWAFAARQIHIARLLLSRGADIESLNSKGWTPLFYLFGSIGTAQKEKGSTIQMNEPTVIEYMQFISSASCREVNAQDSLGWTSMHRAAVHGQGSDILDLLSTGESPSMKTKVLQWSPIFMAVYNSNVSTFEVLADHQPGYWNEKDIQGWNLLHVAAGKGCTEILGRLLRDGVNIHARSDGRAQVVPEALRGRETTPLEVARAAGDEIFRTFLDTLTEFNSHVRIIEDGDEIDVFFPTIKV
ncbi:ankyrin repeat-containing domain protein [Rhexocercosporidium sp. MPI-PUGE-AT-0058]|nr:ankyrin repeat-containing domain protein [Rhexocercosporidium sp. MPI-PUGE-AT-0058]